jgi:hypothetical protein
MNRTSTIAALLVCLLLPGCGISFMHQPGDGENRLTSAPSGKALVNFHRPSTFGGGATYMVFDSERFIGNTKGATQFQYVCDPGEHVFIGSAQKGSAIRSDLAADQVYDIVINIGVGWVTANITMEPITKSHGKRGELADWEARQQLWIFDDDDDCRTIERRRNAWAKETLEDFLNGSHTDRLQALARDDHR